MAAQVIIKLIPDTTEMSKADEALESIAGIDKATADQIRNTNKAFAERAQVSDKAASSAEKFAKASASLTQSVTGGAISQASASIDKIAKRLQEGSKEGDVFRESIETATSALEGLSSGSDEFNKLKNEITAATTVFEELNGVIASTPTDRLKQLDAVMAKLSQDGMQNTEVYSGLKAEYDQITNAIKNAGEKYKSYAAAIETAREKQATLSKNSPEFDKLAKEIQASELAMGNFSQEATSSRGKLKQYRETLLQLEDAGLDGTDVFNELAQAAGELSDQIGDAQARIAVLSSDTFGFDVGIQAAQGITGAFGVAQGAMALFGVESEELQKALLKVNAAMAVLSGLQSIQNILQKESALYIGASIALEKIQVVTTKLQTAAESESIIVRYAAIAAQKVLNTVMAANPAGVILFSIAALATALVAFTEDSNDAAEAQKKLNDALEISIDLTDGYVKAIADAGSVRQAQLKAQNAIESQLAAENIKNLQSQLAEQQKVYDRANDNYAKANQAFIKLGKDATDEDAENRKKAYELANTAAQKQFDIQKQLDLAIIEQQRTLQNESLKNATAFAQARVAQSKKDSIAETEAQKQAIKTRLNEQLNGSALLEGERAQLIAEANRQISELTIKAQQQLLDKQIALAQANELTKRDAFAKLEAGTAVLELKAQRDRLGKSKEEAILIETQKNEAIRNLRIQLFGDLDKVGVTEYSRSITRQRAFNKDVIQEEVLTGAALASARLQARQKDAQDQIAADEAAIERAKRLREAIVETTLNTASSIAGSLNDIAKNLSDKQLEAIQNEQTKRQEYLQKQLDQGAITQAQFNSAQLALQEEYERKSKAIKIRAAQQEKQLALFQAGIAQSLAILAILKDQTIPFTAKPIFIGLALAQAVAQIAAIASKPIPTYRKGTKNAPGGLSIVGEAGPELVYSNGVLGYAAGPTLLDLPKGSKVIPNLETEKIMNRYDIPLPKQHNGATIASSAMDYKRLAHYVGKEVGAEISKMPVTIFGYDKTGPFEHITTMQNRRKFINNRYGRRK